MATFDTLISRNRDFAAQHFAAGASQTTGLASVLKSITKACIIGCADPRVDPAHVLGIEPGEAVVLRNIGGRVTPGTLQQMGLLNRIAEVAEANPGGGGEFHLIVLQHTDCGITRLGGDAEMLDSYFEVATEELNAKAIMDPRAAVAVDVAALRANPALPGQWLVSGLVYDVATGLVETVVPPTPLRAAEIA